MRLQLKRIICLALTLALTACASAPTHYLDKDDPGRDEGDRKVLSESLEPGGKIGVVLQSQRTLTVRFDRLSEAGLVGWAGQGHGFETDESGRTTIPWEQIAAVELPAPAKEGPGVGRVLLAVLVLVGVSALIVANGSSIVSSGS